MNKYDLAIIGSGPCGYVAGIRAAQLGMKVSVFEKDKVLIIGSGPIGLGIALLCQYLGAKVIISDIDNFRLDIAKSLGIDRTVNIGSENLVKCINDFTGGFGVDVVFEASGTPEGFLSAIDLAASGGRIGLIGNGKREVSFNHSIILKKELDIFGSRNSLDCFPEVIRLLSENKIKAKPIITHVLRFEEIEQAFKMITNKKCPIGKILIRFQ